MRPSLLNPLFAEIETLPGVGPRLAKLFQRLAGPRVVDLCWHLPASLVDRRYRPSVAEAEPGRVATLTLTIEEHLPGRARQPYRVRARDESGFIELVWFHARGDWLSKLLPRGEKRRVSGRVEVFNGRPQMAHPDYVTGLEEGDLPAVEAVYPLTAGLQPKVVWKAAQAAVARAPSLPEWQDPAWLKRRQWSGWLEALKSAHAPGEAEDLSPLAPARARLAYDELLANQLALAL
ncbi:MAG: OB-fold nucleic acid binding domain-containing protein, partial [Tistlia sp.]